MCGLNPGEHRVCVIGRGSLSHGTCNTLIVCVELCRHLNEPPTPCNSHTHLSSSHTLADLKTLTTVNRGGATVQQPPTGPQTP